MKRKIVWGRSRDRAERPKTEQKGSLEVIQIIQREMGRKREMESEHDLVKDTKREVLCQN